jgi:hypothetical protein
MGDVTPYDDAAGDADMFSFKIGRSKKRWQGDLAEFCSLTDMVQERIMKRVCERLIHPSTPRYKGAAYIAALHGQWGEIPDGLVLTPCASKFVDIIKVAHDAVQRAVASHTTSRRRLMARAEAAETRSTAAEAYSTAMLHVIAAHRDQAECCCCYDTLCLKDISVTSCGHVFCGGCLVKWRKREIKKHRATMSCPICRAALPLDNVATTLKAADVELFLKLDARRSDKRPREEEKEEGPEEPPHKTAARVVIELE